MAEKEIGFVTHYFNHLGVAAVKLTDGELVSGDTIHVKGHTSDFKARVDSIQLEHRQIDHAGVGMDVGIRVPEHAREHDRVFKVA